MIDTTKKGVAFEAPPERLIPDLQASMSRALANVPEGKNGALVAVATEKGVNAAVVARVGDGWDVQAWIGKSWGTSVIDAGAAVRKTW